MNSPIVWENHVFLTGANQKQQQVYCFDADSGNLLWTGDVNIPPLLEDQEALEPNKDTGYAASTTATEGRRVYAIFPTGVVEGITTIPKSKVRE